MTKAKKGTATKNNGSSLSSLHPPYLQRMSEAITTMKDRTGSSQPAIAKFIEDNYTNRLPQYFKKILSVQLKKFVKSEKLFKVKNSYKISAAEKDKKSSNPSPKKQTEKLSYTETEEKSKKTKRLSQVKTPEALKKPKTAAKIGSAGLEKKKTDKAAAPAKRKTAPKSGKRVQVHLRRKLTGEVGLVYLT